MAKHKKTAQVRHQIIQSTDELLYQKGFNLMSFTDIANAANIPRGNLNYHFKTKNDVLSAVIDYRIDKMKRMLKEWNNTIETPLDRLKRYANIPLNEKKSVCEFGCPMGTLTSELGKKQKNLQGLAKQQMDVFKQWLITQFEQLCPEQNTNRLAEKMLIRTQGLSVLAHMYQNTDIISREVESIERFLDRCSALP
ncbi:MAG TPA: TetR/AcrR family transcriptional regulator [Leucothrix mucor]|nr:TetR/AcrR family transcriptional regulator [Leucothrix mucor]